MNITGYFQFKTAAINSAFAVPSTVKPGSADMGEQCSHAQLITGTALSSLQPWLSLHRAVLCNAAAHGTTNLTASTLTCSAMLKAEVLHPPSCSWGSKSWLGKKHVLCTGFGLKEEWRGGSQPDLL